MLLLKHGIRESLWVAKGWMLSLESWRALSMMGHGGKVSEALGGVLLLREGHL